MSEKFDKFDPKSFSALYVLQKGDTHPVQVGYQPDTSYRFVLFGTKHTPFSVLQHYPEVPKGIHSFQDWKRVLMNQEYTIKDFSDAVWDVASVFNKIKGPNHAEGKSLYEEVRAAGTYQNRKYTEFTRDREGYDIWYRAEGD
jgi:hypothetical protein